MGDFFDRLDKYMNYKGLNDNKLTVLAQLSIGSLGKQRKGSRGLSAESIAKILHVCSDLNADWLLTGVGEMLKKEQNSPESVDDGAIKIVLKRDEQLIRENERLIMRVEELEKKLGISCTPPRGEDMKSVDI